MVRILPYMYASRKLVNQLVQWFIDLISLIDATSYDKNHNRTDSNRRHRDCILLAPMQLLLKHTQKIVSSHGCLLSFAMHHNRAESTQINTLHDAS